jgi:hypothetical protein
MTDTAADSNDVPRIVALMNAAAAMERAFLDRDSHAGRGDYNGPAPCDDPQLIKPCHFILCPRR